MRSLLTLASAALLTAVVGVSSASAGIDLSASGKPAPESPSAETRPASNIADTGARLNGKVNPHNRPTTYYFEYGRTTAYGSRTSDTAAGRGESGVSAAATISGLTAGTSYHFRIVARSDAGTTYGTDRTFTTTGSAPVDPGTPPGDGGSTPGDGGSTPGDGGSTPGGGGSTPGDGGSGSGGGTTTPGGGGTGTGGGGTGTGGGGTGTGGGGTGTGGGGTGTGGGTSTGGGGTTTPGGGSTDPDGGTATPGDGGTTGSGDGPTSPGDGPIDTDGGGQAGESDLLVIGGQAKKHKRFAVAPTAGRISVNLPGPTGFQPLIEGVSVPIGSIIDAREGTAAITTELDSGKKQTAEFWGEKFKVRQPDDEGGLTEIRIRDAVRACDGKSISAKDKLASARKKKKRRRGGLWGRDTKGRWRTHGHGSQATTRGTTWFSEERCEGTYTKVVKGSVLVRDHFLKRNIVLDAGENYLARPHKKPVSQLR